MKSLLSQLYLRTSAVKLNSFRNFPRLCPQHPRMSSSPPVTVGIVVIGDEIITGRVQDTNSHYMCQRLSAIGVPVKALVTVPDDLEIISRYVKELSSSYTYVLTAGGIGPTHDDITYEVLAKVFNEPLKVNTELETRFRTYFKEKFTDGHKKLATIPESASLIQCDSTFPFPIVNMGNVYTLPGVPRFLKLAFPSIEKLLGNQTTSSKSQLLYLTVDEMSVAPPLSLISEKFSGKVSIGSYPEWENNYYKLRIVLTSEDSNSLSLCEAAIRERITDKYFIDYEPEPLREPLVSLQTLNSEDERLGRLIMSSIDTCTKALSQYSLDEICIGFNGGKDCTALLHIW